MNLLRYLPDEPALLTLGGQLARACQQQQQGAWIYLSGELGAGKTTLVRGFMREWGYVDRVKSPTYSLVESYEIQDKSTQRFIYHFDFYRINQAEELVMMGLEEYFHEQALCLVEWPEHALPALPTPDISILLQPQASGRQVTLTSQSPRGVAILEQMTYD